MKFLPRLSVCLFFLLVGVAMANTNSTDILEHLKEGDIILHLSRTRHTPKTITKGKVYHLSENQSGRTCVYLTCRLKVLQAAQSIIVTFNTKKNPCEYLLKGSSKIPNFGLVESLSKVVHKSCSQTPKVTYGSF